MECSPSWEANSPSAGQEIPTFYGNRWFITVFTRAHHWAIFSHTAHLLRFIIPPAICPYVFYVGSSVSVIRFVGPSISPPLLCVLHALPISTEREADYWLPHKDRRTLHRNEPSRTETKRSSKNISRSYFLNCSATENSIQIREVLLEQIL
jgi:hypothetical protein